MKTVVVLARLLALVLGETVPTKDNIKTKAVDAPFVGRQKKVLSLLVNFEQGVATKYVFLEVVIIDVAKAYDIKANIKNYTNKTAVEEFLSMYRTGFLPKYYPFSVFQERQRDEAIALFHLFYYGKDFETFYKTAAYAKLYLNEQKFLYAYYIAVLQRPDTQGIVLPDPYEVYPSHFVNMDVLYNIDLVKMGEITSAEYERYGIVKEQFESKNNRLRSIFDSLNNLLNDPLSTVAQD